MGARLIGTRSILKNQFNRRAARRGILLFAVLAALALALAGSDFTSTAQAAPPVRAHPALLKLAKERPNDLIHVIVQQYSTTKLSDQEKAAHGLKLGKPLDIINGFAAEMPLNKVEALAKHNKVRWITIDSPVRSSAVTTWNVGDRFGTVSYANNDGTAMWATDWMETGDDNSPSMGGISINSTTTCPGAGRCLVVQTNALQSIARTVNLANADTAKLVFTFQFAASGGQMVLEVSNNDGASWTTLQTFATSSGTTAQYNLTPYRSARTQIRFRVTSTGGSVLRVDNLIVGYNASTNDPYTPVETLADEFTSIAFNGSNGTLNWTSNPWTEMGEADGPSAGKVRVVSSAMCNSGNCLRIGGQYTSIANVGASRKADLSKAFRAALSFQYRRDVSYPTNASVSLQVSPDGVTWTTLATYNFMGTDFATVSESFDLTPYKSSNTRIRFLGSGTAGGLFGDAFLCIDDLRITYTVPSVAVRAMRVDQLKAEMPSVNGQGITVAVVDSGITAHPDLENRVLGAANYTLTSDTNDGNGHGTFVAGLVGGDGDSSNGARSGVAPRVNLVNVKVSDTQGRAYTSDVVHALQWIYNNRATYNIKVVNLSLNSTVPESYNTSPLSAAVEILWFSKIVVVVSAGNNGTGNGAVTLYPPANDPFVLTVGAADDNGTPGLGDDTVSAFSAYGTTESGFAKPDLVAPGRNLVSLLASPNAYAYVNYPANRIDASYFRMSGTSGSAALVTGAAALLLQDEPTQSPDQIKYRLKATANTNWSNYNPAKAGAGSLDVYAAVKGTTTQAANIGIAASQLLFSGANPAVWDSVNWDSVNWDSVNWDSVNWDSVNWDSVNWDSWKP